MTNPFFHRGPINDMTFFVGRDNEIRTICSLLSRRQSVALHGQRRFGKTSLLFQISQAVVSAAHGLNQDTKWIYIDGGTLDGLNEEWFYGAIIAELNKDSAQLPYEHFIARLRNLAPSSQVIVILDEFELIAANRLFGTTLFNRLRGLTAQFPIRFVTISKEPLSQLSFAHPDTLSSPFFNIFAPVRLSIFREEEARNLLHTLSVQGGQLFSNELISYILNLVGYHPLFLQIAGYHSFTLQSNGKLSLDARHEVQRRVTAGLEGHMQYYWNNLNLDQQYALAASPFVSQANTTSQAIQESGLTYNSYQLSEIASDFIARQQVSGLLQQGSLLLDIQRKLVAVNHRQIHLTQSEFEALKLFVENPGQILTPEDIEAALWPDEIAVDPERVRGIIKRLRASLGDTGDMIANRRGQGYFLNMD